MSVLTPDLCIIGAGSGGLSLAAGAVQMGASVVLIEAAEMGGDCLNTGCVPSKALLAAAKVAATLRKADSFGLPASSSEIDFSAVKDHVFRSIAAIAPHDSQERFEGLGVTVLRGWAKFVSPKMVEAAGHQIRARRFVIATGSHAALPPVPGLETVPYLTNETLFALRERPTHLIILGGGPIGLEMAQAHRRLGCRVTVIEAARLMGRDDPDCVAIVAQALRQDGVDLREGQAVARLRPMEGGIEAVLTDGTVVTGSHLLVAVGRKPALARLALDVAHVAHTDKGVTVSPSLRSVSNRRVYAIGDAAGGAQFTHVAADHAGTVIRQVLFGLPAKPSPLVPRVTYTDPELAQVGLTEAEARQQFGDRLTVSRVAFDHNDRAITTHRTQGLLKVMIVKGRAVGVSIAGPEAGELIGLWALAISSRLKMGDIAGLVLPYPTLGETAKRAAGAYFSPRLFDSPAVKRVVRLVQRLVP